MPGEIQAALQNPVDQGTNERGAINRAMALSSNAAGEVIQIVNLALKEDDGHLCPCFLMDLGATRSPRCGFYSTHGVPFHSLEILAALLPAQTHPFDRPHAS
jgi:hypothetical protein